MTVFTYESLPGRVVFGSGSSRGRLHQEVERLGAQRILLIVTDRELALANELSSSFSDRVVATFDRVAPHVPSHVADEVNDVAAKHDVDALLSVGGGSTTGTAKIVALRSGLPIIAVPTTYAGSEMTPVWGLTTDARKETGRDIRVLPQVVVYDPDLVRTLPRPMAIASALNAMAHCVEALWTPDSNPVTALMATEGARTLARGMRQESESAAADLLYGAYLAGASFAVAGSGLHHKICHALGGAFNLPHAETHAVVLPHVLAYNIDALGARGDALAAALEATGAVEGLHKLYEEAGAPTQLSDLGLTSAQLDEAIDIISEKLPIANPRPVTRDDIAAILRDAYGEA